MNGLGWVFLLGLGALAFAFRKPDTQEEDGLITGDDGDRVYFALNFEQPVSTAGLVEEIEGFGFAVEALKQLSDQTFLVRAEVLEAMKLKLNTWFDTSGARARFTRWADWDDDAQREYDANPGTVLA